MPDYEKMYHTLFHAATDAIEELDEGCPFSAREILARAQQETESYIDKRTAVTVRRGGSGDAAGVTALYEALEDYLAAHTNYPGWLRDVYPTRADAERGIEEGALLVAELDGRVAGTCILRHKPEEAYYSVRWGLDIPYEQALVVYTFAVHPDFLRRGVGEALLGSAEELARAQGVRSLRLDVVADNAPAIGLYEKCGFRYVATVDLGLGQYGLDWFKLYEKLL